MTGPIITTRSDQYCLMSDQNRLKYTRYWSCLQDLESCLNISQQLSQALQSIPALIGLQCLQVAICELINLWACPCHTISTMNRLYMFTLTRISFHGKIHYSHVILLQTVLVNTTVIQKCLLNISK